MHLCHSSSREVARSKWPLAVPGAAIRGGPAEGWIVQAVNGTSFDSQLVRQSPSSNVRGRRRLTSRGTNIVAVAPAQVSALIVSTGRSGKGEHVRRIQRIV